MQTHLTRRHFIHTTAVGLAAMSTGRAASPNGNPNHACIGVGGIGAADMRNFLAHSKVRIVAICDVDGDRLEAAGKLVPDARKYTDWRELLAKEGDRIDSVKWFDGEMLPPEEVRKMSGLAAYPEEAAMVIGFGRRCKIPPDSIGVTGGGQNARATWPGHSARSLLPAQVTLFSTLQRSMGSGAGY